MIERSTNGTPVQRNVNIENCRLQFAGVNYTKWPSHRYFHGRTNTQIRAKQSESSFHQSMGIQQKNKLAYLVRNIEKSLRVNQFKWLFSFKSFVSAGKGELGRERKPKSRALRLTYIDNYISH